MKQVLKDRKKTIFIDLRQSPISSEDDFMFQFIRHSGYNLPSNELFSRWLLREKFNPKNASL